MKSKILVLLFISVIISLISCVTSEKNKERELSFSILKPSGKYSVGITHYVLERSFENNTVKTIPIQIWYPAKPRGHERFAPYNTPEALALMKQVTIDQHKIPESQLVNMMSATNNSYLNAPVLKNDKKYPVIIFSPGHYSPPQSYTALLEDMASHGYIVLSISQAKFPPVEEEIKMEDKKFHKIWEDNVHSLIQKLPQLKKNNSILEQANLTRIGLTGHSFGGSVSLQVCEQNTQCKCAINIDGYLKAKRKPKKLFKPSLALMANDRVKVLVLASEEELKEDKVLGDELIKLFNRSKDSGPSKYIEIDKMNHFSFTDVWLLLPHLAKKEKTISGEDGTITTRKILLWFFNKILKNKEKKFPNFKFVKIKEY